MSTNPQELLNALRFELQFLEHGGYERSVREPRRELSVFQESPSCLNYASTVREHPCSECFLMDFVPAEKHSEFVPCHHIPLNDRGDTLENMQGRGQDFQIQEAMRGWLHKKITELEKELALTEKA